MPYKYMDPSKYEADIAQLKKDLANAQELNRQASDMISMWRAKWDASTEGQDAALQAIADANMVPMSKSQLAGKMGNPNPEGGDLGKGTGPSFTIHPPIEVSVPIESAAVGTDPTVSASSTSEPDASSSPAPDTSTTEPTAESTETPAGSSPTPTTED